MIQLDSISKFFQHGRAGQVTALKEFSLRVEDGEYLVIIGSNGSGKTTLLNIIAGAERPSSGRVSIAGLDVTRLPEHRRSPWIARVFQNPYQGTAPDLSILDNFRLAALRTQSKNLVLGTDSAFKIKVKETIARLGMGLENKLSQLMGNLSGGQRQALTLLMCVMDKGNILLLDEPTAALDPKSAASVLRIANQLISEFRLTAICITHNLREAQQNGTRLIQLQEGKLMRDLSGEQKVALSLQDLVGWFE
jgi:putative ABC transport system ATP-binding protein